MLKKSKRKAAVRKRSVQLGMRTTGQIRDRLDFIAGKAGWSQVEVLEFLVFRESERRGYRVDADDGAVV